MARLSKADVENILKSKVKLSGNYSPTAALILKCTGHATDVSTVVGLIEVWQASKVVKFATSSAWNVVGALLMIPSFLIDLKNASDWGLRMAGLIGISWGTVAWTFGDKMPTVNQAGIWTQDVFQNRKVEKAYKSAFSARNQELDKIVRTSKQSKLCHQLALKIAGKGTRQGLNKQLVDGIYKTLSGVPRVNWEVHHKYNKYPFNP